ncbi:zinc ABC transporter substrate-binding protein [Brachyspira aalborgi]|uniref:metal ABC transporter substrate-binding protein n=1 Tax=Brachyspira aalborgi TaxID=29522 RepID=UPI0011CBC189|nr:metal ABC transporter substrate-binding protein [Brachyspira aalborgi]TXJ52681.1 zinc ABC transporter substrate-binding protein [Brachyspira aalborgi]
MDKIVYIFIRFLLIAFILIGCGNNNATAKNDKLSIVATIFPEYDWVNEILGDKVKNVEVTMLLDNGVDLHSYQPTINDIAKISDCDMFIYVGGESDGWVNDALKNAKNDKIKVINLLEVLGDSVKTEELIEGMQEEHYHHHEEITEEKHEHEYYEEEKDEHVWLSLKNTKILCKVIADNLSEIDPENKDIYSANVSTYIEKLSVLDEEYKKMVNGSNRKIVLFGDRFPFRYLVDDYGIDYYAAFVGCSAETEASFETVAFLSKKTDELKLPCVLTIEGANHKIAETVVANTYSKNQKVFTMDSMQSTTSSDVKNGITYIFVMEKNLDILREALK